MIDSVEVHILDNGQITVPYGTRVVEVFSKLGIKDKEKMPIIASMVNNELTSLSYQLEVRADIRPVGLHEKEGQQVYRRSLCFLLALAAYREFRGMRLVIRHSLGKGYYFYFENHQNMSDEEVSRLENKMRAIVEEDLAIRRRMLSYCDALEHFKKHSMTDTELLLEHRNENKIPIYECAELIDLAHGPLAPSTGMLETFALVNHPPGFILRYPSENPRKLPPFKHYPILFSVYQEYKQWGKILNVTGVGGLNRLTSSEKIKNFIRVAESLQDKKISSIADKIAEASDRIGVILVAGPSSSGKTTFTKKLGIALTVLGFTPLVISLDDYFVSRENTPRDEDGNYDFESLSAIDIDLLNDNLKDLFSGKELELPRFDFKTGKRQYSKRSVNLGKRGIVLMEGIHGLNDDLTPRIERDRKYKIYVSALTQLNLDDHNRISTTDNRLIRRMVRDYQFRGHSALDTLKMWPSVRRGEDRNIFPYQDSADSAFNSALDYELGVLKSQADPLLRTIKPFHHEYNEALRLLSFLNNFSSIPDKYVPEHSILREFIGGSAFEY